MKKLILILLVAVTLSSCADEYKQQQHLQSMYPNSKVEPATGLIQDRGYDFIVIDTTGQIIAVSFYPFSETAIESMRNIR